MLRRGLLAMVAIAAVLGAAAWVDRESLLRLTANIWIVSDELAPADAVAVLGGGVQDRPFAAAAYYKQGVVKKVLVANVREGPAERLGALAPHTAINRQVLLKLGVAERDIETFGDSLSNTFEEVLALRAWAERAEAHRIIVPTEIFAARRVRWMLRRTFGDGFMILVPTLEPREYRRDDWWRHPEGIVTFQNEILKYVYYRLRY